MDWIWNRGNEAHGFVEDAWGEYLNCPNVVHEPSSRALVFMNGWKIGLPDLSKVPVREPWKKYARMAIPFPERVVERPSGVTRTVLTISRQLIMCTEGRKEVTYARGGIIRGGRDEVERWGVGVGNHQGPRGERGDQERDGRDELHCVSKSRRKRSR